MNVKRLRFYFLASLLLHFLLFLLLQIPDFSHSKSLELAQPIWIDLKKGKYEIADILPPLKEERPKDSKFLGMYDNRVEEEKVAETKPSKGEGEKPSNQKPKKEKVKQKLLKDLLAFSPLTAREKPSPANPGGLTEDFYPDFHRGAHTYLNVLRFPDIQYFVMLKKVFKMTFNPIDPLREAYFQNRITMGKVETVLGVSIDAQGNLAELFVFHGSGIKEFDEEALRTIRASSPFSKPPPKVLEKDGLLRMSWTFTVYL